MGESLLMRDLPEDPAEKVPMHPDDYHALLAWVRAKDRQEKGRG